MSFNVIFFTIKTMFDVTMRLVQYWSIKNFMICHKSRSFNSLQHFHFIEIGFTVQCKDLHKWRFPCLLEFRSFSSSFFFQFLLFIFQLSNITKRKIIFTNIEIATFKTTLSIYFRVKISLLSNISIGSCVSKFSF